MKNQPGIMEEIKSIESFIEINKFILELAVSLI